MATFSQQTSTPRRWLSVMGRLALIVSVWNAPLPMLHAHGTDVDDATPSAFSDHMSVYHPDAVINSHFDFGWHWHLVPPPSNHPGKTGSSDGHCPYCPMDGHDTLVQTSPAIASAWAWSIAGSWCDVVPPESSADASSHISTRYLDTYLGSVPLGTLLRVARR